MPYAHSSCLKGGGITFAVLGTGIDTIYPVCNTNLADKVMEKGCLISEFPLGTKGFSSKLSNKKQNYKWYVRCYCCY